MTKDPKGKGVTVWLPVDLFAELSNSAKAANRSFSSELAFQARKGIGLALEPELKFIFGPREGRVEFSASAVESAPLLFDYVEGSVDEMIDKGIFDHIIPIPTEEIPRKDERNYELAALMVLGEEMNGPSIHKGDIVYFGRQVRQGDGLYVLRVDKNLLVRRLRFNHIERRVQVSCDNAIYDQKIDLPLESFEVEKDVEIIGMVLAWTHRS